MLAVKMRESGAAIHALSGRVNTHLWVCGQINSLSIVDEVHHVSTPTISGLDQC